jgi:hypothetical protein
MLQHLELNDCNNPGRHVYLIMIAFACPEVYYILAQQCAQQWACVARNITDIPSWSILEIYNLQYHYNTVSYFYLVLAYACIIRPGWFNAYILKRSSRI